MFFRKKIEECGIRNGKMTENKKIKIGIISDTHGLLRTEVLDIPFFHIATVQSTIFSTCQLPFSTVITAMVTSPPKRLLPQLPGFSHSLPSISFAKY